MDVKTQQVTVGFRTPDALAKGEQVLRDRNISTFETESPPDLSNVPQKRRASSQSGLSAAAILGGVSGAAIGALISALATGLPNLPSLEGSTTELFVLVPLGGAVLGAIASSLLSLLSGANPEDPDFAYYKILVKASSTEEAQALIKALTTAGGRLL